MKKVKKSAERKALLKKEVAPPLQVTDNEVNDLREFALEAEQVALLENHNGWRILARDFSLWREELRNKLPYIDPKSKEYNEARILLIVADKLLTITEDYSENRKRYLDLLNRIDNPQENIVLDVDN